MRSNSDLWVTIGMSVALVLMMCWLVYDEVATANLGLVIPVISYASGYLLHQSFTQMKERDREKNKR
jgi:hypothetical protein